MKNKSIQIAFSCIFWFLIICMVLSGKIEEIMIPQVTVVDGRESDHLPADCLYSDSTGNCVYGIYQNSEWDPGTHVGRVKPEFFIVEENAITLTAQEYDQYIQYTTKSFAVQERVQIIHQSGSQEYRILLTEDGQDCTALLTGKIPYMEKELRSKYGIADDIQMLNLDDIESLHEEMWKLYVLPVMIILFLILQSKCLLCISSLKGNLRRMAVSSVIAWGTAACIIFIIMYVMIRSVSIPQSVIPGETIFSLFQTIRQ